jgi:dihydrodipicolinate synthase/N-acetylneuraminate lyase
VLEIVLDQVSGRINVVAHVGTASTAQSLELAQHASSIGADYIASVPPYYHGHDQRTVVEYFRVLTESVDVPVYVYNNPRATGVTITSDFLCRLAGVGVVGMKDSSFSYIDFVHMVLAVEQGWPSFRFIIGTEAMALPAWMAGAQGSVSGLANAFPEIMSELWDLYQAGKYEEAARLQMKVIRARQVLHIPGSTNAACYAVLRERGVDVGYPKAPILEVTSDAREAMFAGFRELGML